jgi:hypothetical protein
MPILLSLQAALVAATVYLLGLLVAARDAVRRADGAESAEAPLRLVILVPAHDEAEVIEETLDSLSRCEYEAARWRTVLIADNCTDATAALGRAAGVEVWERTDAENRGKGFAIGWALERLFAGDDDFDAVVMVDADCTVSANLLSAISSRLAAGIGAVQVDYVASNPDDSTVSALRFGAFALTDTVRFLGKQRLGLSCGLVGTGMGFRREVLASAPWTTTGLVEDGEYHMRLVLAGVRTEFVAEAWVSQAVPTSMKTSSEQQARWEKGKAQLVREWTPRLLASGLTNRDPVRLHAGAECLLPPQSVIALGGAAGAGLGALTGNRRVLGLALATLLGQATFVLGGLRLVRAPAAVYRALLSAPLLLASKLALYARLLSGRGPEGWVRTKRESA